MAYKTGEIGNNLPRRAVIRVNPDVQEGVAYAQNDVLHLATEIPNAVAYNGGCSLLRSISIFNGDDTALDLSIVFTQGNYDLGPRNAAANISADDAISAKMLGHVSVDWSGNEVDLINSQLHTVAGGTSIYGLPVMLQASSGSTSVYFSTILISSPTPNFANSTYLQFYFNIEY